MILVTRVRKNNWFRRFWSKNKKTRVLKMKKILIVVSRYNDTNFLLNSTKQVLTKTKLSSKQLK